MNISPKSNSSSSSPESCSVDIQVMAKVSSCDGNSFWWLLTFKSISVIGEGFVASVVVPSQQHGLHKQHRRHRDEGDKDQQPLNLHLNKITTGLIFCLCCYWLIDWLPVQGTVCYLQAIQLDARTYRSSDWANRGEFCCRPMNEFRGKLKKRAGSKREGSKPTTKLVHHFKKIRKHM